MSGNVVQVLTYKSVETILAVGGTQSWALDRNRAKGCKYAVCCRNANTREAEGNEAHGSAFIVGKVSDVVESTDHDGRWLVLFSEYATVNVGDQWEGRNPVRFYTVEDYEGHIDFDALDWKPMPEPQASSTTAQPMQGMNITQAKAALAATFGVDPSAVEITIRG
ncbi:hypothetical protein ROTAS13_03464 [Roseomonas sp. TAS13]|uniref:hypothetical protein n=1 Tax=Roseomonas sp. TAS13 TaxID=1926319 RepID=UPI000961C8EC|nr:hypothetical protein [Roseomonas sp. TAS13]USQ74659.1 hypothetical protein NF552_25700 [Roseomonas mucosa]GAV35785.1 hypothetical protein ROTAS13_03464 [Roseomonas sp. TAS13]